MNLALRSASRALSMMQLRALSARDLPMGEAWQLNRPWNLPPEQSDYPWAYRLIPTIQFCVDLYQSTLAGTPLKWYTGEGARRTKLERRSGNIVDLWESANTEQTGYELMEDLVGSMEIAGNAYLFKDFAGTQKVRQLWVLNPMTCAPVRGPGRAVVHYEVQEGARIVKVPRDQIVHFKRFDPEMGALGVSRLQALQLSYETQRDSSRFLRQFYKKGGTVAGHYSTEHSLDNDDIERLKQQIKQRFQGVENSWEPVMLPKALKFVRSGLTMAEMQFIESEKLTAQHMYKIFKIPPMLAGELEGGTGLNSDVAQVSMVLFLRFGVIPAAKKIATKINEALLESGEFGFGISCEFDFSNDPVMVEAWLKQAEMWHKATGAPHVSRAEARERQELKPRPASEGLDDILVPLGLTDTATAREMAEVDLETAKNPPPPPVPVAPQEPAEPKQETREIVRVNRETRRARANRRLTAHESRVATFARRHFLAQTRRLKSKLREQSRAYDLSELLRELEDPEAIKRARKLVRAIVSDAGDDALSELALDLGFALTAREAREFIANKGAKMVRDIDATTREALREALSKGITEGAGLDSLIMEVDGVMGERLERASRIARTETAAAYNFGTLEGYRQSGVVEMKEWLSSGDEAVRDTHSELDGQQVPLGEVFHSSSGASLAFPGDPDCGDPGETVNCRCTLIPVVDSGTRSIPESIAKRMKNGNGKGKVETLESWLAAYR